MRRLWGLFLMLLAACWCFAAGGHAAAVGFVPEREMASVEVEDLDENSEAVVSLKLSGSGYADLRDVIFVVDEARVSEQNSYSVIKRVWNQGLRYHAEVWNFAVVGYGDELEVLKDFSEDISALREEVSDMMGERNAALEYAKNYAFEKGKDPLVVVLSGKDIAVCAEEDNCETRQLGTFAQAEVIWREVLKEMRDDGRAYFELGNGTLTNGDYYGLDFVSRGVDDVSFWLNGERLTEVTELDDDSGVNYIATVRDSSEAIVMRYWRFLERDGEFLSNVLEIDLNKSVRIDDEVVIKFKVRLWEPRYEIWNDLTGLGAVVCENSYYEADRSRYMERFEIFCPGMNMRMTEAPVPTGIRMGESLAIVGFVVIMLGGIMMAFKT